MDFRGTQQNQPAASHTAAEHPGASAGRGKKGRGSSGKIMGIVGTVLMLCIAILVIAVLVGVVTNSPKSETKYVKSDSLQAVFLNNGQVYFGKIQDLNEHYLRLTGIYYLRVNQTVQPKQGNSSNSNDVSLVKLGCELHGPEDQMVINADQVTFWENLKSDGQVTKAVNDYVKANPNGQTCSTSNNSTNSNTNQ